MPATVVTTWLLLDVLPVVVGVAVVGVVMLIWRGFCWARRLGRRSTKPAASDLVDDLAPVAYDSLQRDLSEGIQAIEDVQVQVQNLYSGVQGAQALHSEVETCFSAALDAASIEDTVAPEVTVAELEQMLQEETRKRWSVIVIKDMEIKAVEEKFATLSATLDAIHVEESKKDREAFDVVIREKDDEIALLKMAVTGEKQRLAEALLQVESQAMQLDSLHAEKELETRTMKEKLEQAEREIQDKASALDEMASRSASDIAALKQALSGKVDDELAHLEHQTELDSLKAEHDAQISALTTQLADSEALVASLEALLTTVKASHDSEISTLLDRFAGEERSRLAEVDSALAALRDEHDEQIVSLQTQLLTALTAAKAHEDEHDAAMAALQADHNSRIADILARHVEECDDMQIAHDKERATMTANFEEELATEKRAIFDLQAEFDNTLQERTHEMNARLDSAHRAHAQELEVLRRALSAASSEGNPKLDAIVNEQTKQLAEKEIELSEAREQLVDLTERLQQSLTESESTICGLRRELSVKNEEQESMLRDALERFQAEADVIIDSKDAEVQALRADVKQLQAQIDVFERDLSALQDDLVDKDECLAQKDAALCEALLSAETKEGEQLALADTQMRTLREALASAEARIKELKHQLGEASQGEPDDDLVRLRVESAVAECRAEFLNKAREWDKALQDAVHACRDQADSEWKARVKELGNEHEKQLQEVERRSKQLESDLERVSNAKKDELEKQEAAFESTLHEALTAVRLSKDSELDEVRLEWQEKLLTAQKQFDEERQNFDERLQAELAAQNDVACQRLKFYEATTEKLQTELQAARSQISDLSAQISVAQFKADGAGVLLDRLHTSKVTLARTQEHIASLKISVKEKTEALGAANDTIEKLRAEVERMKSRLSSAEEFKGTLQSELSEVSNQLQKKSSLLQTALDECNQLRVSVDTLPDIEARIQEGIEKEKKAITDEWEAKLSSTVERMEKSIHDMLAFERTEAEGRLLRAVQAMQVATEREGQIALQEAVERERSIALERLKAVLHDSQAENERRLEEVNNEWKQQLQLQQSIIGKLKSQLEERSTENSNLSREGPERSASIRTAKTAPVRSKENLEGNALNNSLRKEGNALNNSLRKASARPTDTESLKSGSSRGRRQKSRRQSDGGSYWKASDFDLRQELGRGRLGSTFLAVENKTRKEYAVKKISKRLMERLEASDTVLKQIETMARLRHPYMQALLGSFEDDRWVYIVREYVPNAVPLSTHQQRLLANKIVFPPTDVAQLVDFIAQALEYVHQQGEIHRQVSLSKIILSASGRPRLAGPSPVIAMPVPPPECVRDGERVELTAAVDSWGLGIVAYTLLVGKPPFMASEDTADPDMIIEQEPTFSSNCNPDAKDLIQKLLHKDASLRISMEGVLHHPFVTSTRPPEPEGSTSNGASSASASA
ncbi:unnamed protein product (mitochondrion) [Plasmodiophora brassicae]|uniref:Protein kinase domain-containing protein n=1 Tax=Plasmodiophora brassicae TaxID=37360 RepID=A0A3P3YK58_PLABS|nr:unnamed protein product [Plasmodiophora brassicae]